LNGITYVPYKKCIALLKFVVRLGRKIWKRKDIPLDWARAYIILLAKSQDLANISEFRPIAITSTSGKIFFSVISDRLQFFMIQNNYISREIQKGFLFGVPGCLEHSFTLMEALKEAKELNRQIVISWIDLANAYGSVRHNLIQFALNWYHVPILIQQLIFDYYEKLCAMIKTKEWATGFFLFDIGLFQGCVLSTILFDCVFQLLLDFLRPIKQLGYTFKSIPDISISTKAYADDLTLTTRNVRDNQIACNITHTWLKWTITMKSKPSKCVTLGFRKFDKKIKNEKFKPVLDTIYSPFDPCLTINEQPMRFIFNPEDSDTFKAEHFKFLGRWIHYRLSEHKIKTKIWDTILKDFDTVDNSLVNGFMKLWIYQFYILAQLSWPFLIYDFNRSFVVDLQREVNSLLKKWAGIYRSSDNGLLFRSKEHFGLGLTSIIDHFEKMQLIKCSLLQNSIDPTVQLLYRNREQANAKLNRVWKATQLAKTVNAEVTLDLQFPTQSSKQGIGFGNFKPNPSNAERRTLITAKALLFSEQKRMAHSLTLKQQGVWLQWSENTLPFDFSWKTSFGAQTTIL